jgi:hypothetical protein
MGLKISFDLAKCEKTQRKFTNLSDINSTRIKDIVKDIKDICGDNSAKMCL